MKILSIIALAATMFVNAQVGIGTSEPTAMLHVTKDLRVEGLPLVDTETYIAVLDELGNFKKMPMSSLSNQNSCPTLVSANSYFVRFKAPGYIANPNNPVKINGITFNSAEAQITNNEYRYAYTNVSGQVLNTTEFSVLFGTTKCNYKP